MTLQEAINHAEEKAKENEKKAKEYYSNYTLNYDIADLEDSEMCKSCAEEHQQLAEWLKELKTLRAVLGEKVRNATNS